MCRGCEYLIKGQPSCDYYNEWREFHESIGEGMHVLEQELNDYITQLDTPENKKQVDRYRRFLIRHRRMWNAATEILNKPADMSNYPLEEGCTGCLSCGEE